MKLFIFALTFLSFPIFGQTCRFDERLQDSFQNDPEIYNRLDNLFRPKSKPRFQDPITIQVVVHILWNNTKQNISDHDVIEQIEILNRSFNSEDDLTFVPNEFKSKIAETGIRFCLASMDPFDNPSTGIERKKTPILQFEDIGEDALYFDSKGGLDAWNVEKYLNIWVANIDNEILGWATYPGQTKTKDGVVIHTKAFGLQTKSNVGLGKTTVHEVGHYFGLKHIWGSKQTCESEDDISDTPTQKKPNYHCPTHPSKSCNTNDMFMNFMDYVDDKCMLMFTKGQMEQMISVIEEQRSGLLNQCDASNNIVDNRNYLFPNPTNNWLNIHSRYTGQINIYNTLGQKMLLKDKPTHNNTRLDISTLFPGIYFMVMDDWVVRFVVN